MPSMFVVTPVCLYFFMLEFVVGLRDYAYGWCQFKRGPCMLMFVLSLQEVVCLLMVDVSLQEAPCMFVCCIFTGGSLYSYGWHQFTGYLLDFLHAYVCMQFKGGPLHAFVCFYITGGPPFGSDRNAGGSILSISSDLTEELGPSPELLTDNHSDNPQ